MVLRWYKKEGRPGLKNLLPRYFQWVAVAAKIWKRLGGCLSQPGLILGVDSNCFGGREEHQGCVKKLRTPQNSKFPGVTCRKLGDFGSQAWSSFPPSKLLRLQAFKANGNSRFLGTIGLRRQPTMKVNPLETERNQKFWQWQTIVVD